MRGDLQIRLPSHIAELVDRLATAGRMDRREVVRQAILTLAVILENQADNTSYITSIRRTFGKDTNNE